MRVAAGRRCCSSASALRRRRAGARAGRRVGAHRAARAVQLRPLLPAADRRRATACRAGWPRRSAACSRCSSPGCHVARRRRRRPAPPSSSSVSSPRSASPLVVVRPGADIDPVGVLAAVAANVSFATGRRADEAVPGARRTGSPPPGGSCSLGGAAARAAGARRRGRAARAGRANVVGFAYLSLVGHRRWPSSLWFTGHPPPARRGPAAARAGRPGHRCRRSGWIVLGPGAVAACSSSGSSSRSVPSRTARSLGGRRAVRRARATSARWAARRERDLGEHLEPDPLVQRSAAGARRLEVRGRPGGVGGGEGVGEQRAARAGAPCAVGDTPIAIRYQWSRSCGWWASMSSDSDQSRSTSSSSSGHEARPRWLTRTRRRGPSPGADQSAGAVAAGDDGRDPARQVAVAAMNVHSPRRRRWRMASSGKAHDISGSSLEGRRSARRPRSRGRRSRRCGWRRPTSPGR